MNLSNKHIKTYKSSKQVVLGPIIIGGIFAEIVLLIMGELEMTAVLIVLVIILGLISLAVQGSLKITIDADQKLLTFEKTNWLGNILFKMDFNLNEIQFEIREQKAPRSGIIYFVYIINNDNNSESNYVAEGFSKGMLEMIKNEIVNIQAERL
ncbi:hypothetical protein ACQKCJ_20915 [Flavobacterium sp. NPDC079362]|uniref:hypothetical protein n=1 Tax=Flavobacterium sp. NPDC079362 TaxID=3390566 RepID=UPI003CFBF3B9